MHKPCYCDGMEFSYSLTLQDAREAFWLHYWNLRTKIVVSVFSLLLLADIAFITLGVASDVSAGKGIFQSLSSDATSTFLILLVVLLFFFGYLVLLMPWIALRPLRKNPALLVVRRASMTSESFDVQAEGGSSRLNWKLYKYWREGKNVIMLKVITGQYQTMPKRGLSEAQLMELRGILTAALTLKK